MVALSLLSGCKNQFGHLDLRARPPTPTPTPLPVVVTAVSSSTPDGLYRTGQTITIRVDFSDTVVVGGTPQVVLETGAVDQAAVYVSGSGTSSLTFEYVVAAGDASPDLDYASPSALVASALRDRYGNAVRLALPSPGLAATRAIVVDGIDPVVSNVTSSTPNGTYGVGQVIAIEVDFSEPVIVTGTPSIGLDDDGDAVYVSGSGTSKLAFTYTVAVGEVSPDLNTNVLAGSIADLAGNPANLTIPVGVRLASNKNLVIDGVAPAVLDVTSSNPNATYGIGAPISIQVAFPENVVVTGTPQLTLETGAADAVANYVSGSGTSTLTFSFVTAVGQQTTDLDYTNPSALALNGGTIRDLAGNTASLLLPVVGALNSLSNNKDIAIATTTPQIVNLTSTLPDGLYGFGETMTVRVVFDQIVICAGTAELLLETGVVDAVGALTGGSGTTTLTFTFTIQSGYATPDLDAGNASALSLIGGSTLRNGAGIDANLTVPVGAAAGSLATNKNLVITTPISLLTVHGFPEAGAKTGRSSAFIGETNGDGLDDTLTGQPFYSNGGVARGVVHLTPGDLLTFPVIGSNSSQDNGLFGEAVAGLGDINHDGRDDFIVGSPGAGAGGGLIEVFSGRTKAFIFSIAGGPAVGLGTSVGGAGDVNGDGFNDFIAGEPNAPAGGMLRGQAKVYSGKDATVLYVKTGAEDFEVFGSSVTGVGDVNRDGFADFAVGAPNATAGGNNQRGRVVIYSGADGTTLFTILGVEAFEHLGGAISGGNDVNRDGRPDLVVGAQGASGGGTARGRALVVSGLNGTTLCSVNGLTDNGGFGFSVSLGGPQLPKGDVNRNGSADFIVGAPSDGLGRAFVYDGATCTMIYKMSGQFVGEQFGYSVALGGDVNGDGRADLMVGSPGMSFTQILTSGFTTLPSGVPTSFVLDSGANKSDAFGWAVAGDDLNGDGKSDPIVGSFQGPTGRGEVKTYDGVTKALIDTFDGNAVGAEFGHQIKVGGDVNRDGYPDYIAGALSQGAGKGYAEVHSGKTGALLYTANGTFNTRFGANVAIVGDISPRDGFADYVVTAETDAGGGVNRGAVFLYSGKDGSLAATINGKNDVDIFGSSVAAAGDVNRDGTPDIFVGARNAPGGGVARGEAYVISGADLSTRLFTFNGDTDSGQFGGAVAAGGDVDGDGFPDLAVSCIFCAVPSLSVFSGATGATLFVLTGATLGSIVSSLAFGGDVNGDGREDILAGTEFNNRVFVIGLLKGNAVPTVLQTVIGSGQFGHVGRTGDINADGFADFLVGAIGGGAAAGGEVRYFLAPPN